MTNKALDEAEPPAEIKEIFITLCEAAMKPNELVLMGATTSDSSTKVHYIVGLVQDNGTTMIPLAIIPHGLSVMQHLKYYDLMAKKVGGAELDPDFKGVRQ